MAIIAIVISGTFLDGKINPTEPKWRKYIRCFSLRQNLTSLLNTESSKDDIAVVHGARFLNAIALLLSHKQMAMLFNPFMNKTEMAEVKFMDFKIKTSLVTPSCNCHSFF